MPGSQLDGREPAQVTEYQRDEAGRLVRSVTTTEPRWTDRDVAELLALAEYRASLCPCGCGFQFKDTTSHESTGPEFTADRTVCRARLARLEAEIAVDDGKAPGVSAGARLWTIRRR